jgi:hypothetical protein
MARFAEIAKQLVQKHLDAKCSRERAFSKAKTAPFQAIVEYDKRIDEILERFDNKPPKEWDEHIGHLIQRKGEERELIQDIEELEATGFGK